MVGTGRSNMEHLERRRRKKNEARMTGKTRVNKRNREYNM